MGDSAIMSIFLASFFIVGSGAVMISGWIHEKHVRLAIGAALLIVSIALFAANMERIVTVYSM